MFISKKTHIVLRLLLGEVYSGDIKIYMDYYGNASQPVTDFPFNFLFVNLLQSREDVSGTKLKSLIDLWLENMPEGRWPNWVVSDIA